MTLESGPIPLYHQLQEHLHQRILGGEFKPGDPLPTEEQLCAQYEVSRITVRRALDGLLGEGLIQRRRGVGTFAADPVKSVRLVGSLEETLSYIHDLTFKVLSRQRVEPPPLVAKALGVVVGGEAVCLQVLGHLRGEPFAHTDVFLPESIGPLIRESDVAENVPIYRIVEKKTNQRAVRAEQTIEPVAADRVVARRLGIKAGAPILKVIRIYYTATDQPLEAAVARYHPHLYRYSVQLVAEAARQPQTTA